MELEGENRQSDNLPSDDQPNEGIAKGTSSDMPKTSKIPIPVREKSTCVAEKSPFHYRFLNNPAAKGPREWQHQVPVLTEEETNFLQETTEEDYAMVAQNLPKVDEDPIDVEEAKSCPDWPEWKKAMDTEILQLENLGTYIKVKIPKDRIPISCKWVF